MPETKPGLLPLDARRPASAAKEASSAMEPTSVQEQGRAHAKVGSLDNPEVVQNVPGHVIPILEQEFDDFDTEAARFLRGETEEVQFIGFRLRQGVYGQR